MSLLYSPETKQLLDRISRDMPHALLLEGSIGVGLTSIAKDIAWHDLADVISARDKASGEIDTGLNATISVTQIRDVITQTRGKLTKRQIYIIDDADKMSIQAQNAFLKQLEEPHEFLSFILTSHAPNKLLSTVISRVQRIHVQPISEQSTRQLISKLGVDDPKKTAQLMFLASGLPAEITRLVCDEKTFETRSAFVADARQLIQGTPYQRAIIAHRYHGDRNATLSMIAIAQTILKTTISSHPQRNLITLADHLADAYDRIAANANIRLQLMSLVLQ